MDKKSMRDLQAIGIATGAALYFLPFLNLQNVLASSTPFSPEVLQYGGHAIGAAICIGSSIHAGFTAYREVKRIEARDTAIKEAYPNGFTDPVL